MSIERIRACACGLRSVWPQSIPGTIRSLAYANSPFTFGGASTRGTSSPILPTCSWRGAVCVIARGEPHGVEDLRVAGAAAEVAGERLADLVVRRARGAPEQIDGRDDEARRAEAALHGARVDERLLHRGAAVAVGEPFDGRHLVPVGLRGEHEARADERAVEQHRARAALALLARVLRAREARASRAARRAATRPPSSRPAAPRR